MSIFIANLKHLYQCRSLWPVYGLFSLFIHLGVSIPLDRPLAGEGNFVGLIWLQLLIGICTASLPVEILTKPFSYCLPGHRKVPRKFLLSVGVVTSFVGSLIFIAYPKLFVWELPLVIFAAFCVGLAMYWLGVVLTFVFTNPGTIGFIPALFMVCLYLGLHIALEATVIRFPSIAICVGLTSTAVMWIWLGDSNRARRFCATSRIGFFDIWNLGRLIEYTRKQASQKYKSSPHPEPWVEQFFMNRINSFDYKTPGRFIWSELYKTYGMELSRWRTNLRIFMLPLALFLYLSYVEARGTSILFFIAGITAMYMRLPVYSSMTISGGRKERFYTTIILIGLATLLTILAMAFMVIISTALALIKPQITLLGKDMFFHTTSLRLLIIPVIIIPIAFTLRLIVYMKPFSTFLPIILTLAVTFTCIFYWSRRVETLLTPTLCVSLLILSWLVLVLVLRHVCMKRSLVGQGRTY